MAKCGGDYLRKGGTQGASLVCGSAHLRMQLAVGGTGDMAEFVIHRPLLCHDQQQQEA